MRTCCISAVAFSLMAALSTEAQGTFQNLDFESAKIVLVGGEVAANNAIPGWHAYSNTTELAYIPYNSFAVIPRVGLYASNSYVVEGNFSVWLSRDGSIAQTGAVPANAMSLLFKTFGPALSVTLGGQALSCVLLTNGPGYTMYGADISAFAGQTAALTFALPPFFTPLDDIQFSPEAVPEPWGPSIAAAGALLLAALRGRSGKGLERRCGDGARPP